MKRHHGFFDRVLVDAPCSGSGTWRRNPDLRLRVSPAQLQELQAKQLGILTEAASMVKSGGRLIYATCSLFQEENEHIIDAFLAQRPEYQVMPIQDLWPSLLTASCPTTDQFLRTNPHQHGMDGFFTAVLVRR
jgi:16S rRNA (cytosine967-C5)-methyltransferase